LNKNEKNNQIDVDYLLATTFVVCSWIAPRSKTNYENNKKKSGENNRLMMLLDTESYDYVENDQRGLGFKISMTHPLEMPIIEQSAIKVQLGTAIQLPVSATLITTSAYGRKC
jgi:hypothetical protein